MQRRLNKWSEQMISCIYYTTWHICRLVILYTVINFKHFMLSVPFTSP